MYSESAEELLKRKKVHRSILFQYLSENNVVINPLADKATLVVAVCQYWQSSCITDSKVNLMHLIIFLFCNFISSMFCIIYTLHYMVFKSRNTIKLFLMFTASKVFIGKIKSIC